jgi:Zinc-finger associated domain (zf-AD)
LSESDPLEGSSKAGIEPLFKPETSQCRCCGLDKPHDKMKALTTTLHLDVDLFDVPSSCQIVDLFTYCTKQEVDLTGQTTKMVCPSCVRKLIETYEFLKTCENGLAKLKDAEVIEDEMLTESLDTDDFIPKDTVDDPLDLNSQPIN